MKKFILSIMIWFFKTFYKIKITGLDNINVSGKRIYICNHQSVIDAIIIFLFIPDKFVFVMDKTVGTKQKLSWSHFKNIENFKKLVINRIALFITNFSEVIKVNSASPYAIVSMINAVNDGKSLVIFPEGKITLTGKLEPINDGVGLVAEKTDATIIPLKIDGLIGTYFSYVKMKKKIFSTITLDVGIPFKFDNTEKSSKDRRASRIKLMTEMLG